MTDARTSEIEKAAELAIDKQCGGRYTMAVGNINIPSFTYDFIAALSAAGKVIEDDWQPIETAPKDGTRLLLFGTFNRAHEPYEQLGHWFTSNNVEHGGWWVVSALPFEPTHWRHVPKLAAATPPGEAG